MPRDKYSRGAFMCWQNFPSRLLCSLKLHCGDTCCLYWHSGSSPEQNFVVLCKNSAGTQFRGCVYRHGMVLFEQGSYSCCLNCSNNLGYWKRFAGSCRWSMQWLHCRRTLKTSVCESNNTCSIICSTVVSQKSCCWGKLNPSEHRDLFPETDGYCRT